MDNKFAFFSAALIAFGLIVNALSNRYELLAPSTSSSAVFRLDKMTGEIRYTRTIGDSVYLSHYGGNVRDALAAGEIEFDQAKIEWRQKKK